MNRKSWSDKILYQAHSTHTLDEEMVRQRQRRRTVGTSDAAETACSVDVENVHLDASVAFLALAVENVAGRVENVETSVEAVAELNAVVVDAEVSAREHGDSRAAEIHLYSFLSTDGQYKTADHYKLQRLAYKSIINRRNCRRNQISRVCTDDIMT